MFTNVPCGGWYVVFRPQHATHAHLGLTMLRDGSRMDVIISGRIYFFIFLITVFFSYKREREREDGEGDEESRKRCKQK